jgi:uncharacterized protein (DUF1800 family)
MGALQPFQGRWNRTWAAHLLNRTGFGPLPDEIERAAAAGLQSTLDALLDFEKVEEVFLPPETPDVPEAPRRQLANLTAQQRKEKMQQFHRENRDAIEETRGWWIRRMLRSRAPLREKMTLFWHGHFATSANDVKVARHMFNQNEFLRRHCLGSFRELLLGVSRDPAMLKYLDNNTNRKQHPNENYARELLELFSMGIGNYTEDDVKAAARAFTGWTFRGEEFVFNEREHDTGSKTFLGRTGNLDGTDIIEIVLQQPCTAQFMAAKLLKFFVSDNPNPAVVEETAALLRANRYEFKPVVRAILASEYFYSPQNYRTQIKSPAQLVVGSARLLRVQINERALAVAMRGLGQDLLYPPNVKGWDGGETWINTTTLLLRYNFAGYLLSGEIPDEGAPPVAKGPARRFRLDRFGKPKHEINFLYGADIAADATRLVDALLARLLQAALEPKARQWLIEQAQTTRVSERPTLVAHLIMSMPDYQLC